MTGSTSTHTETHETHQKGGWSFWRILAVLLLIFAVIVWITMPRSGHPRPPQTAAHTVPPPAPQPPPQTTPEVAPVAPLPPHEEAAPQEVEENAGHHSGCPTHIHIDDLPYGPEGQALAIRIHARLCAHGGPMEGIEDGYYWYADWDLP